MLKGTAPNLTYYRTAGGTIEDYFTYKVYDGTEYSNTAYAVIDP